MQVAQHLDDKRIEREKLGIVNLHTCPLHQGFRIAGPSLAGLMDITSVLVKNNGGHQTFSTYPTLPKV